MRRSKDLFSKPAVRPEELPLVLTVGHSTMPLEVSIDLLKTHGVKRIVDVRTAPRSRHNPQFNLETLPEALKSAKIGYGHMPGLGGLRDAQRDSPNRGWWNSSFRGFADYMQTGTLEKSLGKLFRLSQRKRICLMCAEAVPWLCHQTHLGSLVCFFHTPTFHY
jgi:uncharacterized protein (DUF488 family)